MRTASGVAMLAVVVLLLAATAGALKFYMDRQAMQTMIEDYGATMTSLPVPPGAAAQAFAAARQLARSGDYAGAKTKLQQGASALGGPPAPAPATLPEPPPQMVEAALKQLPPKPKAFFKKHPDLLREAVAIRMAAQSGQSSVTKAEFQKLTDAVLAAATTGDQKRVEAALAQARQRVTAAGPGGPEQAQVPPGAAEQLKQQLMQARGLLAQAQSGGADTKPAAALLDQAEALLKQGRLPESASKMQDAFAVMRQMAAQFREGGGPRPGRPMMVGGGPGGPVGGPPAGFLTQVIGALLGQMQSESPVLHGVMEDLENAGSVALGTNPSQVREILGQATKKLTGIRESRDQLSNKLAEAERRATGGPPGPQAPSGPNPGGKPGPNPPTGPQLPLDPKTVHDLLGRALDEARALSPEDYQKRKEDFVRRLLATLLQPAAGPGTPGVPTATSLPPIETPAQEPVKPEARAQLEDAIRDRLRLVQEPYAKLAEVGVDMKEVGRLVSQARQAVNQGHLLEAAQAANHASDLVCQLLDMYRAKLAAAETPKP